LKKKRHTTRRPKKHVRGKSDSRNTLLKKSARAADSPQEKDSIDISTFLYTTAVFEQLGAAYKLARLPQPLTVPGAESLAQFLKNARKVYRDAHPPGKRGPKFAEVEALAWIARLEHKLNRQCTRKEIIAGITNKDQYGSIPVSVRTAEKIAHLYRQLTRYSWHSRTGQALSKEDVRWLRNNLRPNLLSLNNWWTQILEQWQHAKFDATGLSNEIHDVFTLSIDDLAKELKKLEALRLRRTFSQS